MEKEPIAVSNLPAIGEPFKVSSVYDYFDVLQVWFREPLSQKDLRFLGAHSGKLGLAQHLRTRQPARWNPSLKQIVRLYQPREEAIRFLSERHDVLLNAVEIARDFILSDQYSVDQVLEYTAQHFVQRWHRTRKSKEFDNGNWRTGDVNKRGLVFQAYGDRPCKLTGEINCFHIETKLNGAVTLKRVGLHHPEALLDFPVSEFWNENFNLFEADTEQLGRSYLNELNGTRRRKTPPVSKFQFFYNTDKRTGGILRRVHGLDYETGSFSMQRLVDQLGRGVWLKKVNLEEILKLEKPMEARTSEGLVHITCNE